MAFDLFAGSSPTATATPQPITTPPPSSNGGGFNLFGSTPSNPVSTPISNPVSSTPTGFPTSNPITNFNSPTIKTQSWNGQQIPASIPTKNLVAYDQATGNKTFKLPSFAGGGVYTEDAQGNLVNQGHTSYGGEPKVQGVERDDIIPVSLGGTNSNSQNIQDVPFPAAGVQDTAETAMAKAVKSGTIAPKAAITSILSQKAQIANTPSLWDRITAIPGDIAQGAEDVASTINPPKSQPMDFPVSNLGVDQLNQKVQSQLAIPPEGNPKAMTPQNLIDTAQATPRAVAALTISGYQMFQDAGENQMNLQNSITGQPQVPHTDVGHSVEPTAMSPFAQTLLGTDTIKDLPGQASDLVDQLNKAGITGTTADILASLGVSASTVAALSPLGSGGILESANDAVLKLADNFTKDTGIPITRAQMAAIANNLDSSTLPEGVDQTTYDAWKNYVNKAAASKLAAANGGTTEIPSGASPETPVSTALKTAATKDIFGGQDYTPATVNEKGFPTKSPIVNSDVAPTETPAETPQQQLATLNEKGFPTRSPIIQATPQTTPVAPENETQFANNYVATNPEKTTANYTKIIQDKYGSTNVVSADHAKEAIPGYNGTNSDEYQPAASKFATQYYDKLLQTQKGQANNTVLIFAGGTGAGKTSALKSLGEQTSNYAIVYDTNAASVEAASSKIDKALANGYKVRVLYVLRDPALAYEQGVIPRMAEEGRVVTIDTHMQTHKGSYETIPQLQEKYGNKIQLEVADNTAGPGQAKIVSVDKMPKIDHANNIKEKLYGQLQEARQQNKLTEQQFQKATGKLGATVRGQSEQERLSGRGTQSETESLDTRDLFSKKDLAGIIQESKRFSDNQMETNYKKFVQKYNQQFGRNFEDAAQFTKKVPGTTSLLYSQDHSDSEVFDMFKSRMQGQAGFIAPGQMASDIKDYIAKNQAATTNAKDVGNTLYDLKQQREADRIEAAKVMAKVKEMGITKQDSEQIYHHAEDSSVALTPKQQAAYDLIKPIEEAAKETYMRIKDKTDVSGEGYVHRVVANKGGMFDKLLADTKGVASKAGLIRKSAPGLKRRVFQAAIDENGNRQVVAIKNGQITAINKGVPTVLGRYSTLASLRKNGFVSSKTLGARPFTIGEATTKEIEANTDTLYHKNYVANTIQNFQDLTQSERAINALDKLLDSPDTSEIAVKVGTQNPPDGWRTTSAIRNFYFEPKTAAAIDSIMESNEPGALTKVNLMLRDLVVLNPYFHGLNIASQAFVNRGLVGTAIHLPTEIKSGLRAISDVWNKSPEYIALMRSNAPIGLFGKGTQDYYEGLLNALQDEVDKTPIEKAQGIFKAIGKIPSTLRNSTSFLQDVLSLQRIYEMQAQGKTLPEAITELSKDMPNYRLPANAVGQFLRNPNFALFGTYEYGLVQSLGEMSKDLAKSAVGQGGKGGAKESIKTGLHTLDKIAALAAVIYLVTKGEDKLIQKLTGNPNAHSNIPGVAGLVMHIINLARGTESISNFLLARTAIGSKELVQQGINRDFFTGNQITPYNLTNEQSWKDRINHVIENLPQVGTEVQQGWKPFVQGLFGIYSPKNSPETTAFLNLVYSKQSLSSEVKKAIIKGDDSQAHQIIDTYNSALNEAGKTAGQDSKTLKTDEMKWPQQQTINGWKKGK